MLVGLRLLTIDPGEIDVFYAPRHDVGMVNVHLSRSLAELNAPSANKGRPRFRRRREGSLTAPTTSRVSSVLVHLSRPATSLQTWGQTGAPCRGFRPRKISTT